MLSLVLRVVDAFVQSFDLVSQFLNLSCHFFHVHFRSVLVVVMHFLISVQLYFRCFGSFGDAFGDVVQSSFSEVLGCDVHVLKQFGDFSDVRRSDMTFFNVKMPFIVIMRVFRAM